MYKYAHLSFILFALIGSIYMVSRFGGVGDPNRYQPMAMRGDVPATPEDVMSRSVYVNPLEMEMSAKESDDMKKYGFIVNPDVPLETQVELYAEARFVNAGLPSGFATVMLRIESGTGRRMVSRTGCKGWYQFCPTTQASYDLKDPFNLVESTEAAIQLALDNRKVLKNYALSADSYHLYLAHMIGPRNFKTVQAVKEGKRVKKKYISKAYNAIRPNWHMDSLGKRTGNSVQDYPKFYKAFKEKFESITGSGYQYPEPCWDVRKCV